MEAFAEHGAGFLALPRVGAGGVGEGVFFCELQAVSEGVISREDAREKARVPGDI